ncbi:hypothetical protein CM240_2732 [Clostridium bornimense]|uniref:Uncharacterized protein n=1 Tax=Clostridium bornimense TaxID=1216932 RepID=W6S1T3_9CLOT|nr:hypothetical protein [Clostridium bornimense]CDM69849.1 hypothetical protein CM240_2732 [Clostridium bornimense]
MNEKYDNSLNQWNNIFSKEVPKVPTNQSYGNKALDKGIDLSEKAIESAQTRERNIK